MKVFALLNVVNYEGQELFGVYATKEEAVKVAKAHQNGEYESDDFCVVECELGKWVDSYANLQPVG